MTNLPLQNKLELALISWLRQFGGTIAPELLTDEAGLFDDPTAFVNNPIADGDRQVLAKWPAGFNPFANLTWYPGHCAVDMTAVPRCVVTCAQLGGDISYAGFDAGDVEVLHLSKSDDPIAHGVRHQALRDLLQQGQLWAIQAVVNAPESGPDTRAVQGFGLDALEFKGQLEGRDEKTSQHGSKLTLAITAHLE